MKTFNRLFDKICTFENLLIAARKAERGKRHKANVARFNANLEWELIRLRQELSDHSYRPGPYRHFVVYEAKKRIISAAAYCDRVVHHALCNIIEPLFDRMFIFDSYASRPGKGTHLAVQKCSQFARNNCYVLKCDIRKYFPSIDHQILFEQFRKRIKDPDVLWLIGLIIDSSEVVEVMAPYYFPGDDLITIMERVQGLPIGNQTSQFFANVYLNEFDHFVKEELRCRFYLRYVDDFVIFHSDKARLHEIKKRIQEYLAALRLRLHPNKSQIFPVTQGLDFLGYRIFPTHRLIRKSNVKRFRRRLRRCQKAYYTGEYNWQDVNQRVQSWMGHARWADSYNLRKEIFDQAVFKKGSVNRPAGVAGRVVEQSND